MVRLFRQSYNSGARKREVKHASTPWLALHPDASAVLFNERFGDGQPQPKPLPAFVPSSHIAVEDVGDLLRWDPGASICRRKADVIVIPCREDRNGSP